jgi:GntR family transcriptional regulator/MocR family aminotransferase
VVVPARHASADALRLVPYRQHAGASTRAFRANQPALGLFPRAAWSRAASRRLRTASVDLLHGTDALGYPPLRTAIAEYLAASRGVTCSADQVAIVSGVQDALNVIARQFVDPGDAVCLENPGYTGAARVFTLCGARVVAAPIDVEGAVIPPVPQPVRLAYLTPAHQFPLGVCMSLARRLQWLDWARRTGALLVEDDYDSEFRYSGRPVSALQGLDRHGHVVFTGSFSKVLCPALRLGYLVLPADLVDRVSGYLSVVSRPAALAQAVLCEFIESGEFARHLRRMREVYGERLGALLAGSRRWLRGGLDVREVEAGLQTVGYITTGARADDIVRRAAADAVEVVPLARYTREGPVPEGLQLGFAAADVAEIERGVRGLARALEEGAATSSRRRSAPR